jgi:integrase
MTVTKFKTKSGFSYRVRWRERGKRRTRTFRCEHEAHEFDDTVDREDRRRSEDDVPSDWFPHELVAKPEGDPLVSDLLEEYSEDFVLRGCKSERSLRCELKTLNRHFGDTRASEINIRVLRHYQVKRRRDGKAAATVNKELANLRAAFSLAEKLEVIAASPRFPPKLRCAPPRQGFITWAQYVYIRSWLPEWGQPVLDFGYYSGWRRNEVVGLRRAEVDLTERFVRLDPSRSKNGLGRNIPLYGFGLEAINAAMRRPSVDGHLFCRDDGKRIPTGSWHETWRVATAAARSPGVLFHDLRRTVVRRMEIAGIPRKVAMAWVGHRTEGIYQRYSITTEADLVAAAQTTVRLLGGKDPDNREYRLDGSVQKLLDV